MNISEEKAKNLILSYKENLSNSGFNTSGLIRKQYNFETEVLRGKDNVKIQVYFGKKGIKTVIQGNKESELYQKVKVFCFGEELFTKEIFNQEEPDSYIGTDESGKGDYFGPLVVAAVYVDNNSKEKLKKIGVKDSKEITDNRIGILADQIKKIIGDKYDIISINPEKYNDLHEKTGNVNRILGWAHAKVLENILEKYDAREAISDKFGSESFMINSLQKRGESLNLLQVTKAEKYVGVAAASVLARDRFISWFESNKKKYDIDLPKGASSKIEAAARSIIDKLGEEKIREFAKLHFKNTKKIII